MGDYIYEKVEGMSVGQVIDSILSGEKYYVEYSCSGDYSPLYVEDYDTMTIKSYLNQGMIYTRKEVPWWEGCEGTPIMVRDGEADSWIYDIFKIHDDKTGFQPFRCARGNWKYARPLTTAEREAIKVCDDE